MKEKRREERSEERIRRQGGRVCFLCEKRSYLWLNQSHLDHYRTGLKRSQSNTECHSQYEVQTKSLEMNAKLRILVFFFSIGVWKKICWLHGLLAYDY